MILRRSVSRPWGTFAFCLAAMLFLPVDVGANDSVSIRYLDVHPRPGQSLEREELKISRTQSAHSGSDPSRAGIDRFFDEIAARMAAGGIDQDWQLAVPDAPAIEIVVERGGKKQRLVSCHTLLERDPEIVVTEGGVERVARGERSNRLARESESFRRHRDVFEAILGLALERVRSRFSGDSREAR